MALHIVVANPDAVNLDSLTPARGLGILGISHAPGNIEHRFDIVLPGLAVVNALLVDAQCFVHLDGLMTIENAAAIAHDPLGDPCGRQRMKEHLQVIPLVLGRGNFARQDRPRVVLENGDLVDRPWVIWDLMLLDIAHVHAPPLWFVDIRYLDMHQLGGGMIYCISILEGYSRAILASAVTRRQNFEEYIAVLYAAIRKHGCPKSLVSDHGGVFRDHRAMQIYTALGIEKKEIEKRQSWQNLIETAFNVQRRMGDWYFETAKSWEDLVATHEKWVLDYNFQKHLAHEKREDGRHSPAEVLGWVAGKQWEPDYMYHAFSAICETRTLTSAGYARFRDFLIYGERGLAGKKGLINIFQDTLALEYGEHLLAKYSVEWQPDDHHLLRIGNPRLYEHPYQSPQLALWPPEAVEWFVIIQAAAYGSRPRRKRAIRLLVMQLPLLFEEENNTMRS